MYLNIMENRCNWTYGITDVTDQTGKQMYMELNRLEADITEQTGNQILLDRLETSRTDRITEVTE